MLATENTRLSIGAKVLFVDIIGVLTDGEISGIGFGINGDIHYNIILSETNFGTCVSVNEDDIRFVKVRDRKEDDGYYANWRIVKRIFSKGSTISNETILPLSYYHRYCEECDAMYEKTHDPQYINYYMKHDKNALKEAINRMYGSRNRKYNPLDYTKYNPKHVLLNGRYTTVVWEDGSHTVVKLAKGEEYDPEKAILYAIIKHMNGDVKAETDRYLDRFIEKTIYQSQSKKEFLKELDERDAAGDICQEYNPDEDETFFDDEEDSDDTE